MQKKRHKPIKRKTIKIQARHTNLIGIFHQGVVTSVQRKDPFPGVALEDYKDLKDGDIIVYKIGKTVEVIETLGNIDDPFIYPKIATWVYDLPHNFSPVCLDQASVHLPETNESYRVDLTHIPFVTVDGSDAKDFDDAIYAEPHPEGWKIIVAIADVSHYVPSYSPLDHEAKKRGNSVYFPNTVIPMLPEDLSNDLCSLRPDEERLVLAVEVIIGHKGRLVSFNFMRGRICSKARLTYESVQNALDGRWTEQTTALKDIISNLYGAYLSLNESRKIRGTLNINLPEFRVGFDKNNKPNTCYVDPDYISHKIIEEFMILANVCAARILLTKKMPSIYRNHEKPDDTRYFNLRDVLENLGEKISRNKGLTPHLFNDILKQIEGKPYQGFVQDLVLRCQSQAQYSPYNKGHFGLSLMNYCHFTSPIRRYADLVVHRALIAALNLGGGEKDLPDVHSLDGIAEHISKTERQAASAERNVKERYMLYLMRKEVGSVKGGAIVGVIASGFFVRIENTNVEGFIPVRTMADDYYTYDDKHHRFVGKRRKIIYQLGGSVTVRIVSANPVVEELVLKIEQTSSNHKEKEPSSKKINSRKKSSFSPKI